MTQNPKNLFKTNPKQWTEHNNGYYNPNQELDDTQVIQMTHNIASANSLKDDSFENMDQYNYILKQIDIRELNTNLEMRLENIEQEVSSQKPIILQLCNGHHWITMGLLPKPNKKDEYFAVKMNSYIPNKLNLESEGPRNEQEETLKKEWEQMMADPDPTGEIIGYLKGQGLNITNLDMQPKQQSSDEDKGFFGPANNPEAAIDLSVNQQVEQNCGLMTAANSVSILKTYNELISNPNIFDNSKTFVDTFKKELEKNVFYEKKEDGKCYVLGKETDLKEGAVVQIIGQAVAEGNCTDKEIAGFIETYTNNALSAQLIKKILLEDAIESCGSYDDLEKKALLKQLENGKLTDADFDTVLNHARYTLAEYVKKEQSFARNRQDNDHNDIVSESWSARINSSVQNNKENLQSRQ